MRTLFGIGTPRTLPGRLAALGALLTALIMFINERMAATWSKYRGHMRQIVHRSEFVVAGSLARENQDLYHGLLD